MSERGQGMTEYVIIVALIAIAAIGVIGIFGNDVRALFGMSSDALAGNAEVANRAAASNRTRETKNLRNFAQNNSAIGGGAGGDTSTGGGK